MEQRCKSIRVTGIQGLNDEISVYNTDGVKAEGRFNTKKVYVCEFAIAIKYLKITGSESFKFSYHLVINGAMSRGRKPMIEDDGSQLPMMVALRARQAIANTPTDFWADYTMAGR